MPHTVAVVLRHLLQFTSLKTHRLPDSPRQMLESDLVRLLAVPRETYRFQVPPGIGLEAALVDIFQLYSALCYLYTGHATRLYMVSRSMVKSDVPWLDIIPAENDIETITVNSNGTLGAFLPDLPPEICTSHSQVEYYTTPELVTWLVRRLWNFTGLREGQFEIINRLFQGKSILGILPTGAGKSLCFQLPAMVLPGITLVVSPLKSLMRDQFANLNKSGVSGADFLDSSKTAAEKELVLARLRTGQLKLLYLSPERLQIESFQHELAQTMAAFPISLFAIDEAHCISEWGHDFRPSYLRLRHFISQLREPPICALTATASHYVRQDILNLLGLNTQDMVTPKTLDRSEISLQVKVIDRERDHNQEIAHMIGTEIPEILNRSLDSIHKSGAGVVFAPYAAPKGKNTGPMGTEHIARNLKTRGLECNYYHSQMADCPRAAIQDGFKDNLFPLLVATKGYGMGIDKENIDYIVHACAPASLEAYYQEAGRAGRDGEHAHSVIIARTRLEKCEQRTTALLPACHQGWKCEYTGQSKCDYGVQAGLLGLEYPSEQETAQRFNNFLNRLSGYASQGPQFNYVCSAQDSARHQKYLYYLQQFGAVTDYRVMEYRRVAANHYDMLLQVELTGPNSLDNKYWLANKVVERIETYKLQKVNMLNTVHTYIKTDTCRRRFLMQYFGDKTRYERCNFCDIDGISLGAAPVGDALGQEEFLEYVTTILTNQNLSQALGLMDLARGADMKDDVRIRSMRELEDRPYNPAALFLAGFLATDRPETEIYGIRNLMGLLDIVLKKTPELLSPLMEKLAGEKPELAYNLSTKIMKEIDSNVLKQLAATLTPPEQYPDIHLTLLLPQLKVINKLLNTEVTDHDPK